MGLGTLLLNTDETARRLRGNGAARQAAPAPAARAAAAQPQAGPSPTPMADFQLSEDLREAAFVIMWPALGCPELVDPENMSLELIFFSKAAPSAINNQYVLDLLPHILVLEWDQARRPYREDGRPWTLLDMKKTSLARLLKPGDNLTIRATPLALSQYSQTIKEKPLRLAGLFHTMAEVVPKAYLAKGFQSVVSVRLNLRDPLDSDEFKLEPGRMYTLFYGPENGLLRVILQDSAILEKPYSDVPLLNYQGVPFIGGHNLVYRWRHQPQERANEPHVGDRNREHLVRLFHPFSIVRREARQYLNVGHITDMHSSSLWDYFDERIFPHYNQDKAAVSNNDGRNPEKDANSLFSLMAYRFNNPNLNMRNLTYQLNQRTSQAGLNKFVDIILQTGDLVDFNRGFNLNARHDPALDYVFNLNWVRYYELLLLDYERPTYTLLGNHDWRLNPYPPRIKAEAAHFFLAFYLLLIGGGTGAACGSIWGAIQAAKTEDNKVGLIFLQLLLAPLAAPLALFAFASLLGGVGLNLDVTYDVIFSKQVLGILIGGGWLFGLLISALIYATPAKDAATGTLWGAIVGGSFGFVGLIAVFILLAKTFDYMTTIVNLFGDDFPPLLDDHNPAYLRAFGNDGLLLTTERAFDWYALVINPFLDYAFRHGNMTFMMANWAGTEILTGDPPPADDSFSELQWKLLLNWVEWTKEQRAAIPSAKGVIPILGLHTPVFCPMVDQNLEQLHQNGAAVDDENIARGIMDEHRQELIERFFKLAQGLETDGKPIPAISLTGHTHDYDIFRMTTLDKTFWYQAEHWAGQGPAFWNKGLHITTVCAGPPGDGKIPQGVDRQQIKNMLKKYDEQQDNAYDRDDAQAKYKKGDRVPRASGCRVVSFDPNDGSITQIEEISAVTAKWGNG